MQSAGEILTMLQGLPNWAANLIMALTIPYTMCMFGVIIKKTGRNPLWGLALIIPYAGVAAAWVLAYAKWPRLDAKPKA